MCEAGFVHDLRGRCRDVACVLARLLSLAFLNLSIGLENCEHFVAHPIIVQRQSEVSLDLDSLHLANKADPLQ